MQGGGEKKKGQRKTSTARRMHRPPVPQQGVLLKKGGNPTCCHDGNNRRTTKRGTQSGGPTSNTHRKEKKKQRKWQKAAIRSGGEGQPQNHCGLNLGRKIKRVVLPPQTCIPNKLNANEGGAPIQKTGVGHKIASLTQKSWPTQGALQ